MSPVEGYVVIQEKDKNAVEEEHVAIHQVSAVTACAL